MRKFRKPTQHTAHANSEAFSKANSSEMAF